MSSPRAVKSLASWSSARSATLTTLCPTSISVKSALGEEHATTTHPLPSGSMMTPETPTAPDPVPARAPAAGEARDRHAVAAPDRAAGPALDRTAGALADPAPAALAREAVDARAATAAPTRARPRAPDRNEKPRVLALGTKMMTTRWTRAAPGTTRPPARRRGRP